MAEQDWRTVTKAVYIFHRMAVSVDPQLHLEFVQRFNNMQKLTHKRSKATYYNLKTLLVVRDEGTPYVAFLRAYSVFTFERFLSFSGGFDELRFETAGPEPDIHTLLAQLMQARKVMESAMAIRPSKKMLKHEVVRQCIELTEADCFVGERNRKSLWEVFGNGLTILISAQRETIDGDGEAKTSLRISKADLEETRKLCLWARQAAERVKLGGERGTSVNRLRQAAPSDDDLEAHARWCKEHSS